MRPAAPAPNAAPRVLHVAAEVFPLVKTGGLADVVAALPVAQAGLALFLERVRRHRPVSVVLGRAVIVFEGWGSEAWPPDGAGLMSRRWVCLGW